MEYMANYEKWLKNATDSSIISQLEALKGNDEAIKNNFYKDLEFGTAGLRGIMAAGCNCMNIYTVAKASAGMAMWLKSNNGKTIAISYDSRNNSNVFASIAAAVFAGSGLQVYITKTLAPTPFLSFCVRHLKCDAGVMITASHNPKEYNGYKAYGDDGCQLDDENSLKILDYCGGINEFEIKCDNFDNLVKEGKIKHIDQSVEDEFLRLTKKQAVNNANGVQVVYTPLNGAGCRIVPQLLKDSGVDKLFLVDEQAYPDGNFATCPYPNPEKKQALELGLKKLEQTKADLLVATDPDADRTAIAAMHKGGQVIISGNELGMLLADYLLMAKKQFGTLPNKPIVIKSIVSTSIVNKVVQAYGGVVYDVLTGFKHIGKKMNFLQEHNKISDLVLAFEESCGYLVGDYVRDKDAVVTSMLAVQMCAYHKKQGKTLIDRIDEIYAQFGRFENKTISREFGGASGNAKMKEVMDRLRKNPPSHIGEHKIQTLIDLIKQPNALDLPSSNVIIYNLQNDNQVIVRPSGTEPLIKMYLTARGLKADAERIFAQMEFFFENITK